MPDPRSSPPSDDHAPRSGSPTVLSEPHVRSAQRPSRAPYWIALLGLLGVVAFMLVRLTLPPRDLAAECVQAALTEQAALAEQVGDSEQAGAEEVAASRRIPAPGDFSIDAEIVALGKLDVGGIPANDIAKGAFADPIRRKAILDCRAVYVQRMGISAPSLIQVDTGVARVSVDRILERTSAGRLEVHYPVTGAVVSIESPPGQKGCVTSSSGYCDVTLRNLAHDAKLNVAAKLPSGASVSRSTTLLALLQGGLTLEALERAPTLTFSVLSCEDRTPVSGVMVQASAIGSSLWSTDCGPERPEPLDRCREMMGRHGDVSFYYDTRPEQLTVTIIPPGEGARETREVVLGGASSVELTYGTCPEEQPAPAVDCQATRRSLENHAQLTRVPAGAAGHQLDVLVEVMSSGIVSDIQPASGSDPKALAALRMQLAGMRGLAGPCRDMPVTLHY